MKKIIKTLLVVMVLAIVISAFTGCAVLDKIQSLINPQCVHQGGTATCTEQAICDLCGEAYGETLAHTEEFIPAVAPTCTEAGSTYGKTCSVCATVIVAVKEVPAQGHYRDVLDAVAPTCTETGLTEGEWCPICEEIFTAQEEVPATGHTLVDVEGLAPTCTEAGYTAHQACACGHTEGKEEIAATGHTLVDVEGLAPTCEEAGYTAYKACACGHIEGKEEIAATGHTLVDVEALAPTCTEDGYSAHKACACGHTEGKEVVAAAHTLVYTRVLPTANGAGKTVIDCSACDNYEAIEFGEFSIMTEGTYVLNAADLAEVDLKGTTQGGKYNDGDVYVHNNVFAIHLAAKSKGVDGSGKTFPDVDATTLDKRINFASKTQIKDNGALLSGILFTTTETTTVKVWWVQGGDDNRQVALFDLEMNVVKVSEGESAKNEACYAEFTVPAGTYILGNTPNTNYIFKVEVVVAHVHDLKDVAEKAATCTVDGYTAHKACDCGYTEGKEVVTAKGHADENGDYKCDGCSTKMLPADGTTLTIKQALAVAGATGTTYTTQKYYITGTIKNVYNTQYGNMYIVDDEGNELCVYGLYSADGETRYDAMSYKPVAGDEVTVYTVLGMYNTTKQGKDAWLDDVVAHEHNYVAVVTDPGCLTVGYTTHTCSICLDSYKDTEVDALGHTTEAGDCERCGATIGGDAPVVGTLATFEFGANGSAAHVDPNNKFSGTKTYTENGYSLSFTSPTNVYDGGFDAKGNSCIKLGTSSKVGSFTITVPENVTEVIIYVAQYKSNTTKITVNGTAYTITTASNNGAYTPITVDTTTTKTINFATVSGGVRCMIDKIVFNGIAG